MVAAWYGQSMQGAAPVERRIVTVLFADLVGFTPLSEGLDPEDMAAIQDAYFAVVRETVARYGGQLEKFIGDAAMAVFGIPRAREDDAERAVRAGLSLAAAVEALAARIGLETGQLRLRVGINTGDVVHAEGGPDQGRVTGDTVNVAARLQTAAPVGGVLLGEQTALAVASAFELGPAEAIQLKGKAAPVRASLAMASLQEPSRERAMGSLRAPLVGRGADLAWFRDEVSSTPSGGSRLLVVMAPPGVGKSRFVAEASEGALGTRLVDAVWRTRVRPDSGPFEPLGELVRSALGLAPDGTANAAIIDARVTADSMLPPDRATLVSAALVALVDASGDTANGAIATADAPSDDDADRRTAAWLDGFDALASGRTVLWVVEDGHWASADLLAFIATAGERAISGAGRRILLVTARPTILDRGRHLANAVRRELAPLPTSMAADLVRALVGDAVPAPLVETIAQRSDGNALFIEELLRAWIAVGALEATPDGSWHLTLAPIEVTVPTTVQAIYAAQIDDLPRSARAVVRHGSVSGRDFPAAALPALDVADAEPSIRSLLTGAVISGPTADPLSGAHFAFRHALLRDAGYASLARSERARLHVALARWLEGTAGDRANEVADVIGGHYATALASTPSMAAFVSDGLDRAATSSLAADWLERAGDRALRSTAVHTAQDLFERSLALTPSEHVLQHAHRLARLGEAMVGAGDQNEAARHLEAATEQFRAALASAADTESHAAAREGLAMATRLLGEAWHEQLRFMDAKGLAERALIEIGHGAGPTADTARARLLLLAARAEHAETNADTTPTLDAALAVARAAADRRLEFDVIREIGLVAAELGTPDPFGWDARDTLARELGDWRAILDSLQTRAGMATDDDPATALRLLDEAATIAQAHGSNESLAWIEYIRAETLCVTGDLDGAVAACERTLALAERYAYRRAAVRTYHLLLPLAMLRGDREPAARLAAFYASVAAAFPDSPYARVMRAAMDLWIADAGLAPRSVPDVEPRLASFDTPHAGASWLLAVERLVDAWLEAGRFTDVAAVIARLTEFRDHPDTSGVARVTMDLIAARSALAQSRLDEAEHLARVALAGARAAQAPLWMAKNLAVLVAGGRATDGERGESAVLEARLGVSEAS